MAKLLIIAPPGPENFMRNGRCDFVSWSGCQWYPLILGYLAQYLKSKGHDITFIDAQAWGKTKQEVVEHLRKTHYDYVVMMVNSSNIKDDMFFANLIGLIHNVILVGPATVLHEKELEERGFTFVLGEPEHGVQYIIEGKARGRVWGVPLTPAEFDEIPAVSRLFTTFDASKYVAPSEPHPFVDIMTARGCAYGKCTFCLWPKTYTKYYTPRSMNDVLSELHFIHDYGKFKHVMFQDDTLPTSRAYSLSEGIIRRQIKLSWSCYVRAEIPLGTLELMKAAGCLNIHVGYESGNDSTLERVHKGISTTQMKTFTKNAKRAGLQIHGDFLLGIDSTIQEMRKTIDFACTLRPNTAQFQSYIPYFGDKPAWRKEELNKWVKKAYMRFYGNPRSWAAIAQQFNKPRVLARSAASVLSGGEK